MPKRTHQFVDKQEHDRSQGKVKRVASGIWEDEKTGRKIAGGAYEADTGAVEKLEKAIREGTEEFEEVKERIED